MKVTLALLLALSALAACCADEQGASRSASGAAASNAAVIVVGTLLDAASGDPVANVTVHGPRSSSSRSDEHGRFRLTGLAAGDEGEVTAETSDGRRGSVRLRALRPGELEVVVHLTRVPKDD